MGLFMGQRTLNERILTLPCNGCRLEISTLNSSLDSYQSSVMADNKPKSTPEGFWILDDNGKDLKFISEKELDRNATEMTDTDCTMPTKPLAKDINEYLSTLTSLQEGMRDKLRDLGWNDSAIHNILTNLEHIQRFNCAKLRQKGYTEAEIQRLDTLGNENMTDFSHLRRGVGTAADEDYQVQLYLLEEVKRRRLVMLGDEE
ncbi:unnamed protein product [Penicillium olsonii]|nr:unnamed protein product [Penicillium olsonii]